MNELPNDWAHFYFLAAAGVLALNGVAWLRDRKRTPADTVALAFLLLCTWFASWAMLDTFGPVEVIWLYPGLDLLAGGVAAVSFRARPAAWKFLLLGLFTGMFAAHVALGAQIAAQGPDQMAVAVYHKLLDALFIAQLLCAAWPGARHVATDIHSALRRRVPSDRGLGHRGGGPGR